MRNIPEIAAHIDELIEAESEARRLTRVAEAALAMREKEQHRLKVTTNLIKEDTRRQLQTALKGAVDKFMVDECLDKSLFRSIDATPLQVAAWITNSMGNDSWDEVVEELCEKTSNFENALCDYVMALEGRSDQRVKRRKTAATKR